MTFFSDDDIWGVELERNKENTTSPVTCPGEPKGRERISEGDENGQGQEAERPGDLGEELEVSTEQEVSIEQKGPSQWGQMRA